MSAANAYDARKQAVITAAREAGHEVTITAGHAERGWWRYVCTCGYASHSYKGGRNGGWRFAFTHLKAEAEA